MHTEFYQEKTHCGGTLKVNKNRWEIEYYYPGPDGRHKGVFFSIYSAEVEAFTQALINNFLKYEELKEKLPSDGEYSVNGEKDMKISVGRFFRGVSIHSYYDYISTQEQLEARLTSFIKAKERAEKIQHALNYL